MSRHKVDGLDFSAQQQRRPQGMSRNEYFKAAPGEVTLNQLAMAGVGRSKKRAWLLAFVAAALLLAVVGLLLWQLYV